MSNVINSAKERYILFNGLVGLTKALEGQCTTVDLRNDCSVTGVVTLVDGYMNITFDEAILTDRRANHMLCNNFFVKARNIRYVHIPEQKNITKLIEEQVNSLSRKHGYKSKPPTIRSKRAMESHMMTVLSLEKNKSDKNVED